jgi:hypothetical protein
MVKLVVQIASTAKILDILKLFIFLLLLVFSANRPIVIGHGWPMICGKGQRDHGEGVTNGKLPELLPLAPVFVGGGGNRLRQPVLVKRSPAFRFQLTESPNISWPVGN